MPVAAKILEADVTKTVRGFMALRGWRRLRFQRTVVPGQFQTGEPGIPDDLFLRYIRPGVAAQVWIEYKSPGDKRKCRCAGRKSGLCTVCAQDAWHKAERARGGRVWRVPTFDGFEALYYQRFGWLHDGSVASGQLDFISKLTGEQNENAES